MPDLSHGLSPAKSFDLAVRTAARIGIHFQHFSYRFWNAGWRFADNDLYCSWNVQKTNTTFEECRHRDLVRCVQRDGFCPSGFDCLVSQT